MAQSKSFFGLRKGSTKSLTFSVLNGKQVTKDRVVGGKNPRSQAQMIQRMCMATASAGYAAMKQIVDHSFEGYAYGADNMSRFISLNTKAIKADYNGDQDAFGYNPYGDRQLRQGAYIVSQGSASPVSIGFFNTSRGANDAKVNILLAEPAEGGVYSADYVMNNLGVNVGDMATFVMIGAKNASPDNVFIFVRFKFLKAGTVALTAENLQEYIKIESNWALGAITVAGGMIQVPLTGLQLDNAILPNTGVIHSVKSTNGWLRSNVTLDYRYSDEYPYTAAEALATYPVGETYILNGGAIGG